MSQQSSLEVFFEKEKPPEPPKKVARSGIELFKPEPTALQKLRDRIKDLTREVVELQSSALVSATYDGERRVAVLKFYDPTKDQIYLWSDKSGHKPYCFSKQPEIELRHLLKERSNLEKIETITKYEPLSDKEISISKIVAKDPLAIGGQETSLRNDLNCWEADIKYYENYLYDNGLVVGAHYRITNGKIEPVPFNMPKEVEESLRRTLESSKPDLANAIKTWASLLNQPLLDIKHAAIDIEVWALENRIPDPKIAEHPIVAVSLVSRREKIVYLLKREDLETGNPEVLPAEARVLVFEKERDLLIQVFRDIVEYPFLTSFNGDDFDLDYLYHRALRPEMAIPKECVPVVLGNNFAGLRHGVHIDLYKTFNNRSLKIYAFSNKYNEQTLDGIADGLLGESKVEFEGSINDLPLYELARYNLQDADLTYRLASIWNEVLMKVLQVIARVGKMPIDDLSRLGVSNWIRSMLYFEHRRQNALIPRPEELKEKGGAKSEAVIKGKKYKGGLVIEPKSGVHFNVSVLDFASLYPSLIKVNNISYETVDCVHPECRSNVVPGIDTWTCTKRRGIESLVVGSLRDLRVDYYKGLTRSKTLSREDKDLYKVVSQGLKVILNASYGVLGFESFPLYCLPAADAVAALGRNAITKTIQKCRELGVDVVYSDTDSLFIQAPSEDQIKEVSNWTHANLGIELDVDKVYRYVAMSERKKNYFGVLEDGTVDIKGLTGKKSQTPQFIKDSFQYMLDVLSKIKTPDDFEAAREEIKTRLTDDYNRLKNHEISMEELAFNVMIGKDIAGYRDSVPQHVRAALQLQRSGKDIRAGDIISFVKTNTTDGAKPAKMAKPNEIDVDKYIEYMRSTFDQILSSMGYDFDEILGATKLEDFFWSAA